jgi:hypothetical protein
MAKPREEAARTPDQARNPVPRATEAGGGLPDIKLAVGAEVFSRYKVVRLLNSGGTADIYLCLDLRAGSKQVVLKLYHDNATPDERILDLLKTLRHNDVVALLDHGQSGGRYFEVMEHASGGSLADRLKERPFSEQELVAHVLPEVVNGLHVCHTKGIVHRDIKEGNLFYRDTSRRDIMVGDFGSTSRLHPMDGERLTSRTLGTPQYMAPETYDAGSGMATVNREQDYYSLGITLIYLMGVDPFPGSQPHSQHISIKLRNAVPLPEGISERFATLLRGLLHPQPDCRWGHEKVRAWLRGEHVPLQPVQVVAGGRAPYVINGRSPETLPGLGRLLYDHPREAMIDIGRNRVADAADYFDPDVGRRVSQICDQNISLDRRYIEVVHLLDPTLPYRFAPNLAAATPEQLTALIDVDAASWKLGGEQLAAGLIESWLAVTGRADRVKVWRDLAGSLSASATPVDVLLEAFLKVLDPRLPSPVLRVVPETVSVRCTSDKPLATVDVEVSNAGRGHLHGSVQLEEAPPGITIQAQAVHANRLSGLTTSFKIGVDASTWTRGARKSCRLVVETNGGPAGKGHGPGRTVVPIHAVVAFPRQAMVNHALVGALSGAVIAVVLRGIVAMRAAPTWMASQFGHYLSFGEIDEHDLVEFFEYSLLPVAVVAAIVLWIVVHARRGRT